MYVTKYLLKTVTFCCKFKSPNSVNIVMCGNFASDSFGDNFLFVSGGSCPVISQTPHPGIHCLNYIIYIYYIN